MGKCNQRGYKYYVVNVQTIAIDSGWEYREDAMERAVALKEESGTPAKVLTKPRIGFGATETVLDPNDDASWVPKRISNPAVEVGSLWHKRATDRRRRVFSVVSVDDGMVTCEDIATGDAFQSPLKSFLGIFAEHAEDAGWMPAARANPADMTASLVWMDNGTAVGARMDSGRIVRVVGDLKGHYVGIRAPVEKCKGGVRVTAQKGRMKNPGGKAYSHSTQPKQGSGYTNCGCRDCFEITISDDMRRPELCSECEEAGCEIDEGECRRSDAYGADDDVRENPGELLIVNGRAAKDLDSAKAEKVFEMWHKKIPNNVQVIRPRGVNGGDAMVCIGNAHDIVYRSGKWEKGRKTNDYVHTFDSKPKVWMLASMVDGVRKNPSKSVETLLKAAQNSDGQFACADLAAPLSFSVDSDENEIAIHSGARVYGAVDQKTVIIVDPHWKLIVIKGGEMHFDERGIVK